MKQLNQSLTDWMFKACEEDQWLPAKVPGCVHTDLLRNGKIEHPFYGMNERDLQWIDKKDWEYETEFSISEEWLTLTHLDLVFDGLDTYADVYVNERHVLSTDNMFRVWKADVRQLVSAGINKLRVRFRSPVREDLPKLDKLGYSLPATNDQSDGGGLGDQKISVFARKAPYHYGWDWGPRFVTSGIWRAARLEGWSGYRITDVFIKNNVVTVSRASLTAVIELECDAGYDGEIRLSTDQGAWSRDVRLEPGTQIVELDVEITEPKLWWCRGLGDPHMYTFTAALIREDRSVCEKTIKTGIRTVKLMTQADKDGAAFYVELNGVPVFAKGANHIPNDSFVTEMTYERYRHEVATAAESNMNMLRVWGGGIYEDEAFYSLCDEYGILVWQDFMFACSMYPGDAAFLDNVRQEAEENVKRIRNHPCIALWCGNNEIDTAWSQYDENAGWKWKEEYNAEQRERLWEDYEQIFHRILPEAINAFAPGSAYWPSSPMQGITEDGNQHAFNKSTSGDIHYWGVWHSFEPFEKYNVHIGRFMSEYGFQSFPELKSVRTYAEEADLALESEVMLAHQRNPKGNQLIKQYMDLYFREPKDFPSFLYLSQVLQAEAMKTAIEAHRRKKPFCMGTLYWQMNDCWPVASWAGMDYYGRWKALQYYAKRSFQDVLLSIDGSVGGQIEFHVISDILIPLSGTLDIRLLSFCGEVLKQAPYPFTVEANSGVMVVSIDADVFLEGYDAKEVMIAARLEQDGQILDSKVHYLVPINQLKLEAPEIQVKEVEGGEGSQFVLETKRLAKQVWISSEAEGIFSDNYFDLLPGEPRTITFYGRGGSGEEPFVPASSGQIEVRSMVDFVKA